MVEVEKPLCSDFAATGQELQTHLNGRRMRYVFDSNRNKKFTLQRIQQFDTDTAGRAEFSK